MPVGHFSARAARRPSSHVLPYRPIPLVGPRSVLGEPLVPLSMAPTPGETGFEGPLDPAVSSMLVPAEAPLDRVDGQSVPERLLAVPMLAPAPAALLLPPVPAEPLIAASGQLTTAPDADVPGVRDPPVEAGAPDDGPPRFDAPVAPLVPEERPASPEAPVGGD